jgi:hypothetical protein
MRWAILPGEELELAWPPALPTHGIFVCEVAFLFLPVGQFLSPAEAGWHRVPFPPQADAWGYRLSPANAG